MTNWKDEAVELQLLVDDLRDRNKNLTRENVRLSMDVSFLKDDVRYMRDRLKAHGMTVQPVCVGENEYECGSCGNDLRNDYDHYCPGCGGYIDWDDIEWQDYEPEIDPGEQFLRDEVYEPLREQLARERDD